MAVVVPARTDVECAIEKEIRKALDARARALEPKLYELLRLGVPGAQSIRSVKVVLSSHMIGYFEPAEGRMGGVTVDGGYLITRLLTAVKAELAQVAAREKVKEVAAKLASEACGATKPRRPARASRK